MHNYWFFRTYFYHVRSSEPRKTITAAISGAILDIKGAIAFELGEVRAISVVFMA